VFVEEPYFVPVGWWTTLTVAPTNFSPFSFFTTPDRVEVVICPKDVSVTNKDKSDIMIVFFMFVCFLVYK
jgi:hypothetical protein